MTDILHTLQVETHDTVLLAVLTGEIDASNAATIASELSELSEHGYDTLVLDLSNVGYLDSAGIAMLDALRRTSELLLVVPEQSVVHRAMVIVGFDQLVPFFPSAEDALASTHET